MNRFFGYARVSKQEADDVSASVSIQNQKVAIRAYYAYAQKSRDLAGIVEEVESARIPLAQRPGGARLLAMLGTGDMVVFTKLDRGFRDTVDVILTVRMLQAKGVHVAFLDLQVDTTTAMGQLFLTLLGAFAEFERRRIGERTREVMQERKRAGRPTGGPNPKYGFKRVGPKGDRRYVPDERARAAGSEIVRMRQQGFSWQHILDYINANGYRIPHSGNLFGAMAVRCYYKGELELRKAEADDQG